MTLADADRMIAPADRTPPPDVPPPTATAVAAAPLSPSAARVAQSLRHRIVTPGMLSGIARLADYLVLVASSVVLEAFYASAVDDVGPRYHLATIFLPMAVLVLIGALHGYTIGSYRRPLAEIGRAVGLWAAVFGSFTLILFFLKAGDSFSRVWLAGWFVLGAVSLASLRLATARLVRQWTAEGVLERRAVLVGGGPEAVELIEALRNEPENDIRICGIFDDRDAERVPALQQGYAKLGRIDELVEFGRRAEIDMLIVALPLTAEERLVKLLKKLWVLPIDIRLSAHATKLRFRPRSYSFVGSVPFLDVFDKPIADWDYLVKRVFDLSVAALAIVLLSPLMLATMLAVKLDSPGPVFFRQRRYGFNNELIEVYKFRSMYTHLGDATGRKSVTRGDPRVTRVGRFIRKTSIDELPQLVNVILGQLSLVGPRPHPVNAHHENRLWEQVVDGYFARHRVKPGVTGWAQVNGWRGEIDSEEKIRGRVDHDLAYIENWSVLFDIYILMLTPFRLLNTENAY